MNTDNLQNTSRTDWATLEKMRDDEIDYTDILPLQEDFFRSCGIENTGITSTQPDSSGRGYSGMVSKSGKYIQLNQLDIASIYVDSQSVKNGATL